MSSGTAITPRRRAWTDSPAACCTHEHRIRYGLPSAVRPGGAQWTHAVSAEAFARRGHRIVIVMPLLRVVDLADRAPDQPRAGCGGCRSRWPGWTIACVSPKPAGCSYVLGAALHTG